MNAITELFDKTTLSASQISKLVQWLQKTPTVTTIRVNLLHNTIDNVMACVLETLEKCDYLPSLPLVQRFDPLPEVIMIHSIDERFINKQPKEVIKEVIIDVSCATAVLRGAHIYCPGILAMQSNTKINEMVNIFADIEGSCKKGTNIVYLSTHKLFIGIGQVKMQRFQLFRSDSKGIAVRVHNTISCVPSIGSDYLIDQHSLLQIELETASPLFGYNGLPDMGLNDVQRRMVQRFGPNLEKVENKMNMIDSTGFFICKFRKKSKIT